MSDKKFYFRCKTNPGAQLLVLGSYHEAAEMRNHPDYERIDETGEVMVSEEDMAENRIPIQTAQRAARR